MRLIFLVSPSFATLTRISPLGGESVAPMQPALPFLRTGRWLWYLPQVQGIPPSERKLHPELYHAAASRAYDRIAGRDVGCGAPAAERAGGPHVIGATRSAAIAIRCIVRIGDDGVIEDVKELDPELSVVPLEREVLE